jgi:hypothetical protein
MAALFSGPGRPAPRRVTPQLPWRRSPPHTPRPWTLTRSAGATIEEANAPLGFESAHPVQRHIMVFEAARNLGPDVARAPETRQRCLPVDDRERRAPPGARGSHAVTLPSGTGPAGLPLGLQICAAPGSDRALVDAARTWAA